MSWAILRTASGEKVKFQEKYHLLNTIKASEGIYFTREAIRTRLVLENVNRWQPGQKTVTSWLNNDSYRIE